MIYRPGDVPTEIGDLRLTVGGFAEITARLCAPDPGSLAKNIRAMSPDRARHLLMALLRPSGAEQQVARLSGEEIAALMPAVAQCIATALSAEPR